MEITKETIMFEILRAHPGALDVFESHGMNCSGCMQVMKEKLEEAAVRHRADLQALLRELNSLRHDEVHKSRR